MSWLPMRLWLIAVTAGEYMAVISRNPSSKDGTVDGPFGEEVDAQVAEGVVHGGIELVAGQPAAGVAHDLGEQVGAGLHCP